MAYRTVAYHLRGWRSDIVEVSVQDSIFELRGVHPLARWLRPRLSRPVSAIVAIRQAPPSPLIGFPLLRTKAIELSFADGVSVKLQARGVDELRDHLLRLMAG